MFYHLTTISFKVFVTAMWPQYTVTAMSLQKLFLLCFISTLLHLCSTRPLLLLYNTLLLLCLQHFSTLLLLCPCITLLLLSLQCTVADVSVQYAVLNCYVVCCYCCFSTVYITVSWDLLFACLLASCTSFFAASKHTVCNWSLQSVWKRLWLYS